ncbi:MAG: PIN domain-containing protein [Roseovarius sp.]|nr:PIN domain-containing protein [Roseovarius sp.]
MAEIPKYYWDACVWIELINQFDKGRVERCRNVIELARNGKAELWTSAFTLAEVWKKKCDTEAVGIQKEQDRAFENFIEAEFVKKINVDVDVGNLARRLLRRHPSIGKPQDAIHVASCLPGNVDELHTFAERDLIKFDGQLPRRDKIKLKICKPLAPLEPDMFSDD